MEPVDGERTISELRGLKVTCCLFVLKYLVLFKIRSKSRRLEV